MKPQDERFTKGLNKFEDLHLRMHAITRSLQGAAVSDQDIMVAYFNEIMRVANEERGASAAYLLLMEFYWHVVTMIDKMQEMGPLGWIAKLPEGKFAADDAAQNTLKRDLEQLAEEKARAPIWSPPKSTD